METTKYLFMMKNGSDMPDDPRPRPGGGDDDGSGK
jgi:hypothetical protein